MFCCESGRLLLNVWVAGETGNDVEHLMSTSVSVVFVLVGEFKLTWFIEVPDGEPARGDCKVPLSRAGKIFVNVLVTVRWDGDGDDDGEKLFFRKSDGILNDDEPDEEVIVEDDDCNIWVRKAFSADEFKSSFSLKKKWRKKEFFYSDIVLHE